MGPGRRLSSSASLEESAGALAHVLAEVSPAPYEAMAELYESRIRWVGEHSPPARGWSFNVAQQDQFVLCGWHDGTGSVFGLYEVGSTEPTTNPIVGLWQQRDAGLTSTGALAGGEVGLWSPLADEAYLADLVESGGFTASPENVLRMAHQVTEMFLIKSMQFIGLGSPAASSFADRFVQVRVETPQRVLDALLEWDQDVAPYAQDLPQRVRGLLLEPGEDGPSTAHIWSELNG
jgi:hypothetical protein